MLRRSAPKKMTSEVFGLSPQVLNDSYVDRGELDATIRTLLARPTHIALRGESKSGKSWLRQTAVPDAIVVQCRLGKTVVDIYRDALAALEVSLEVETSSGSTLIGRVEARGEVGFKLLARLGATVEASAGEQETSTWQPVGKDITDLRFVADLIQGSNRRLVVEDFHYLSISERKKFAFDLKALWDYRVFVVIVGVWTEQNMLLYLNPDLSGRVQELSIVWAERDLKRIFESGGRALNLVFSDRVQVPAIADCFGNAGILQALILGTLDHMGIREAQNQQTVVDDTDALLTAAMAYAEQLNPLYQEFARRVASGIRTRRDSTGIYAHAMAVILSASDDELLRALSVDRIYETAHSRQPRIQKGNLHAILEKVESLQVDEEGRGLVIAYNEANREVSVVDRQLLLYRKYSTVKWPWEDLIAEADAQSG